VGSENSIDRLYALRADFEQNGALPWPVAVDEPWEDVTNGTREPQGSADRLAMRAFVGRWYAAAVSRLQGLVELQLAPALISRGKQAHAGGGGNYQTLLNAALREYVDSKHEPLEATLRRVLREELTRDLKRTASR
jgi:uncharacterized protein (DUF4415 family)